MQDSGALQSGMSPISHGTPARSPHLPLWFRKAEMARYLLGNSSWKKKKKRVNKRNVTPGKNEAGTDVVGHITENRQLNRLNL